MKVCVLASGSKGNCTYIETAETKILVDVGMSNKYIETNLKAIGVDPNEIEIIFLTHTHVDHINGLPVFLKRHNPTVYLTKKMDEELDMIIDNYVYIENPLTFKDLKITPIKTSHDVADSNGYVFESGGRSLMYMTDTGYINYKNHDKLVNHDVYVLESNHDLEMLMNGKYPYHLKQRILGDKGHLSNKDSAYYLTKFTTDKTQKVILAHLSEENNNPDKALEMYYQTFEKSGKKAPQVIVAKQKERTEVVEI